MRVILIIIRTSDTKMGSSIYGCCSLRCMSSAECPSRGFRHHQYDALGYRLTLYNDNDNDKRLGLTAKAG